MHVTHELLSDEIPPECIADCSASGDAEPALTYWLDALAFTVDRGNATGYLQGFGAWDDDELDDMTDHEIAMRVLWIACGNFADGQDITILEN